MESVSSGLNGSGGKLVVFLQFGKILWAKYFISSPGGTPISPSHHNKPLQPTKRSKSFNKMLFLTCPLDKEGSMKYFIIV